MKYKTLYLLAMFAMLSAGLLTGCGRDHGNELTPTGKLSESEEAKTIEESTEPIDSAQNEMNLDEVPLENEDETKREAASVPEDGKAVSRSDYSALLTDTVKYVDSSKKEITKTEKKMSVVNEKDPSTYKIVRQEQMVEKQTEIPCEYQDEKGYVKYVWRDGTWYAYEYSSGDITLDEKDEDTALMLLELFGDCTGEVVSVNCEELNDQSNSSGYAFHVLYRTETALDAEPEELSGLKVSQNRMETTHQKQMVEVKVPVEIEETVSTGDYNYYGWQEENGSRYYYDEYGEKVTGLQVIQGIRYQFDDEGKLISQTGVDVSSNSGTIDWKKVKESGVDFALIRCGYRGASTGALFADETCAVNVAGARANGLNVGLYIYSQAVTEEEAAEEAEFAVHAAETYGVTAPVIIVGGYTMDLAGRAEGISPQDRTTFVNVFCKKVKESGKTPMIGGEAGWLDNSLDKSLLGEKQIWLAQENTSVTWSGTYQIWQYTAQKSINGIPNGAGLNMITGNGRVFQ